MNRPACLVLTLLFCTSSFFAADRILGFLAVGKPQPIVFPAGVMLRHQTTEFDYLVTTNSWGLRDEEIAPKTPDTYRILALGDSFTYGFGVSAEESWPKILQRALRSAGVEAQVLNLGKPGLTVDGYAAIARKAIPLLSPDLVLVGVLQNDDLVQLAHGRPSRWSRTLFTVTELLPHLSRVTRKLAGLWAPPPSAKDDWQAWAKATREQFTPEQATRYEHLDETVRSMFESGSLNPALIRSAVTRPNYYTFTADLAREETQKAIAEMSRHFAHIERSASAHGASVVVLSVPDGGYVNAKALTRYRRVGYEMPQDLLHTKAMDEATSKACMMAGIPFFDITEPMRRIQNDSLFYEFDGHPTRDGHRAIGLEFARVLLPAL